MAPALQVLTLNVWGLWLLSKRRYNRILHLAEYLANDAQQNHKLDVVVLQEVWVDEDVRLLMSAARISGLSYAMHFRSGVFGSGLLTLSRWPITEAAFHQYNCAGDPASITCGDYLAAKGVGWVRLATPSGPVDVFNTHLHANYSHKYDSRTAADRGAPGDIPAPAADEFAAFRMAQVLELSRFVVQVRSSSGSIGSVLAGDLNCTPDTLEAAVLRSSLPQLRDAWEAAHGPDEAGHTCKASGNSYQPRRQQPSRIDYVFTSLGVTSCEVALQRTPEGHSYSDHFAVHAHLDLPSASAAAAPASASTSLTVAAAAKEAERRSALLRSANEVLSEGVQRAGQASVGHMAYAFIMIMQALGMCAFEPLMTAFNRPLNPTSRLLVPVVVLVLALGAAVFMLTGLVADSAQTRALQQALQQLEATQGLMAGGKGAGAAAGGARQKQAAGKKR